MARKCAWSGQGGEGEVQMKRQSGIRNEGGGGARGGGGGGGGGHTSARVGRISGRGTAAEAGSSAARSIPATKAPPVAISKAAGSRGGGSREIPCFFPPPLPRPCSASVHRLRPLSPMAFSSTCSPTHVAQTYASTQIHLLCDTEDKERAKGWPQVPSRLPQGMQGSHRMEGCIPCGVCKTVAHRTAFREERSVGQSAAQNGREGARALTQKGN